jgi:hypothetical protein
MYVRACLTVWSLLLGLGLFLGAGAMAADDASDWGTVKGQVVFGGPAVPEPPVIAAIATHQDSKHCLENGPIQSEEWVVNKSNLGVRWTFVWLEPEKGAAALKVHPSLQPIKDKEVVIDQPCCKFEPHALALREGQDLVAKNSSPVAHNVNWTGHPLKNPGGNVIIPARQAQTILNLKADRFPVMVKCNIHPWMGAFVRVFDHPYFAVTDADGQFTIKQAPAGKYRLVFWHEATGWGPGEREGLAVTIDAKKETDLGKVKLMPR